MATVSIPKEIENELKITSKRLGLTSGDLLLNAILYYLQALEKRVELKKELELWERTSDVDLLKFEKQI